MCTTLPLRRVVVPIVFAALAAPLSAQPGGVCVPCREGAALVERYELREMETPLRERPGWAPPRKIVVMPPVNTDEIVEALRTVAPGAEVIAMMPGMDLAAELADAEIYIGFCGPALEAATGLRWVQLPSAGADSCVGMEATLSGRDVLVTSGQRIHGTQVAEHALALLLALTRGLHYFGEEQRGERWSHRMSSPVYLARTTELESKTLLVVGLGGIGTEVARRAHALGMRVIATRNSGREGPDFVEYVGLSDELLELAGRADVIIGTLPATDQTAGIFDARFFDAVQAGTYFVNVGRGENVVTADLVEALRSNRLAGAGLDVTDPEPLPPGHPLWTMENVILTPHAAIGSDRLWDRVAMLIVENVRRYAAGDALVSVVDLRRGY